MGAFPSIAAPSAMSGVPEDPAISSKMEDGTVVSRAKFTRSRETITLKWNAMSSADFTTLLSWYKNTVKGSSDTFTYTQPATGTAYTMRCKSFKHDFVHPNRWSVTLEMEEA